MGIFNQDDGSRGGGISRILIAVGIAIVGIFTYMSQEQENPVTGHKQHISLTTDQEIQLGLASTPKMTRQMGGELSATDPRTLEVKKIGQFIISKTEAHKGPWKFNFHLLADTKTVNAFALPGGQVFITLGLLNKLQTEAQLAGVLSHEMGHVIERHTAQQMAKSQLGNMLVVAVGAGTSDNPHSMNSPMIITSVVNHMLQLRYSRHDESEADRWGAKLMIEAGYDPKAMIQVLEILKAEEKKGATPEIFQTHPNPDNRIIEIQAYLKEHPPASNLIEGKKLSEVFRSSQK